MLDPFDACLTAGRFRDAARLNALVDADRIDNITRAINSRAMAGACERRELYQAALAAFKPATALRASTEHPTTLSHRTRTTLTARSSTDLTPEAMQRRALPRSESRRQAKPQRAEPATRRPSAQRDVAVAATPLPSLKALPDSSR